jgi:hypothetical protein
MGPVRRSNRPSKPRVFWEPPTRPPRGLRRQFNSSPAPSETTSIQPSESSRSIFHEGAHIEPTHGGHTDPLESAHTEPLAPEDAHTTEPPEAFTEPLELLPDADTNLSEAANTDLPNYDPPISVENRRVVICTTPPLVTDHPPSPQYSQPQNVTKSIPIKIKIGIFSN